MKFFRIDDCWWVIITLPRDSLQQCYNNKFKGSKAKVLNSKQQNKTKNNDPVIMNNFQIVNSSEVLPTWKSLENHPTVAHQLVKKIININLTIDYKYRKALSLSSQVWLALNPQLSSLSICSKYYQLAWLSQISTQLEDVCWGLMAKSLEVWKP